MAKLISPEPRRSIHSEFVQPIYVAAPIAECSIEDTPAHARSAEHSGDFQKRDPHKPRRNASTDVANRGLL